MACLHLLFPCWCLAAYFSKNLIFDGVLFDLVITLSGILFFVILGQGATFTTINWIGTVVVTIGLILMRLK